MKVENQLMTRIARAIGITKMDAPVAAPEAVVEAVEQITEAVAEVAGTEVEAVVEKAVETLTLHVDTTEMQAVIADLQAQVDAVKADLGVQLETAVSALAEMTGKYEGAAAALAAIEAEKAALVVAQAAAKLAARQEQIEAAIGTEKAAGLMAATEGLDDTQFNAVIAALAGSVNAEASTSLFTEVGVTAEADASKIVEESAEMRILKAKYPAAK